MSSKCVFPVSQSKLNEHENCYKDAKAFVDAVDKCSSNGNKNKTQACDCFGKLNLEDKLMKLGNCSTKSDDNIATQEKKKCKNSKLKDYNIYNPILFWLRIGWM